MGSTIVDMITSTLVFGVLALTVARIQTNINVTMYENQFNVVTQTNAVELARQIEWDLAKIGYHISGQKILLADSTKLGFLADLDNAHVTNTVQYTLGDSTQCGFTLNPHDFPMFRRQDGQSVTQNWGLTRFKITYYDDADQKIATPITGAANLAKIHSIDVAFQLESAEPVVTLQDSSWAVVTWEKRIVPRNLGDLNY